MKVLPLLILILLSCKTPQHIKKIEFETTMCFGACPAFKIIINNDRTAIYDAYKFNVDSGSFRTIIDTAEFNKIIILINKTDFFNLKDKYEVRMSDEQTSYLTITYDNGRMKKIIDYGLSGTTELENLYEEFFELRNNQRWRKN
jgi:hypothetical protein